MRRYLIIIPFSAHSAHLAIDAEVESTMVVDRLPGPTGEMIFIRSADLPLRTFLDGRTIVGPYFEKVVPNIVGGDFSLESSGWGSYVAVYPTDEGLSVFRDPSGQLDCLYICRPGHLIVCSDWRMAQNIVGFKAQIDWQPVLRLIVRPGFHSARTGLCHLNEILPGEAVVLSDKGLRTELRWSPAHFEQARMKRCRVDAGNAAASLRTAIEESVTRTVQQYRRPVLELSGGIDSSILAATLAAQQKDFVCVNYVTPSADGDEREQARSVARRFGAPLIELQREDERIDLLHSAASHLPRPSARAFTQESDRLSLEVAAEVGGDCFVSGGGGDSVFFSYPGVTPVLDMARAGHFGRDTLSTALDVAEVADRTFWWVLERVLRRRRRNSLRWDSNFLNSDAIEMIVEPPIHPWCEAVSGTSAGLRAHVETIVGISGHLVGFERARSYPLLFPLMMQPVIEECLRMPSWLWVLDGYDRSLARRAFADLLPSAIAFRRSKGRLDLFGHALYARNREKIRDLLCSGLLAQDHLLDVDEIATELRLERARPDYRFYRLLELADVEAWARSIKASEADAPTWRP